MINLLFSLILYSLTNAEFKSYDGGKNCAFVYDLNFASSYPLDVCITDYNTGAPHVDQSREYICTIGSDNKVNIQVYTYYNTTCDGNPDESRSALSDAYAIQNNAYQCSSGESTTYDDCYVEYKEYKTASDTCEGWIDSSYQTKYIITGTCVAVDGINTFSQCDQNGNVEYVRFNDDMCCDLSYQYLSDVSPQWKDYNIKTGCNNKMYIPQESWMCNIPDGANDDDVFTDNVAEECTDMGNMWIVNTVVYAIIGSIMYMY
eukprot:173639_1